MEESEVTRVVDSKDAVVIQEAIKKIVLKEEEIINTKDGADHTEQLAVIRKHADRLNEALIAASPISSRSSDPSPGPVSPRSPTKEHQSPPVDDDEDQESDVTAKIIDTSTHTDEKQSYTVYVIMLGYQGESWIVKLRYSHFSTMHDQLRKEHPMINFPTFPAKTLFGTLAKETVDKRRSDLQQYIRKLLAVPKLKDSETLRTYLDPYCKLGPAPTPAPSSAPAPSSNVQSQTPVREVKREKDAILNDMFKAIEEGDLLSLKKLVQVEKGDVTWTKTVDSNSITCLRAACKAGKPEIVRFLLDKGADPRETDASGRSLLHQECLGVIGNNNQFITNADIIRALVASGADMTKPDDKGVTPIALAAKSGATSALLGAGPIGSRKMQHWKWDQNQWNLVS
eukprot:TRINITY_DN345_c0_g1_i5.p1 TRINITY_DN345_c0_g1~~TRINITY_DN345_c0_g1_i5.p1  ORF type:complete len:398 (-),score=84.43 TRINITY_DN345_c0_g1_i5:212-1405(-)